MWVDLQIKYLFTLRTKDAIKKRLGRLPKTLEETYTKIYETISREDSEELEVTKRALMWLMCSRRPLSSQEWASVSYWPEPADQDIGADPLLDMCHNLVTMGNQSQVVRFAHLSVQEYLEKLDDFTAEKANSMAARFCLSVLLSDEKSIPPLLGKAFDYSAGYWMEHASQCTSSLDVFDLLRGFLGTPAKPGRAYCNWFRLASNANPGWNSHFPLFPSTTGFGHLRASLKHLHSESLNPVFAVCYFRLGTGFQDFWDWDAFDIDSRNGGGETLLYIASLAGNEQIVKYLLKNGADVNAPSWEHYSDFRNPLTAAITHRRARIAVTLLDHGASVGFPGVGFHRNTLEFAAEHGDESVVEALIDRDCSTKVTEVILVAAAGNKYHGGNVLEMLLTKDSTIQITEAVLSAAANNSSEKALEYLLAWDSTTRITTAVLSAAARNSNEKVLEILLARDSTIQITEIVLSAAAENRSTKVLEMLLARDSPIQITDAVLSAAAGNSITNVLQMLLTRDPTIQITEAVLFVAAGNRFSNALEILLARDSTIEITEVLLSAAAKNCSEKALEALLARDSTIQTTEALLAAAAKSSSGKALEILLAWDSTIQITEELLSTVAMHCNEQVLEMLLARDSTIQVTEALLSAVAMHCNEKVLEVLLARDSTIQITETILSAAVRNSSTKILEILLVRDSTIQITETVLSVAAGNHFTGALKLLLAWDSTIRITEAVLSRAAVSFFSTCEALEILLARENNIEITEAILTSAAENFKHSGHLKVIDFLARNAGNTNITVNSNALKASAYFASSFLFHKFLRKCDRSSIIGVKYPQFVYAAVQGGDGNILRALLELGGECLEADEHGWTLQMVERQSGFASEMPTSGASNRTHHRFYAPEQLEAGIGHYAQIQVSEPTALDISRLPECINLQVDGSYMFCSGKCLI